MIAFMDESGLDGQNGHSHRREMLRPHFITTNFLQGPFPHLQFSGHQRRHFPTEQRWLANNCNVYPARTASDGFIKRGGGAAMG
jgi:hypothetical protein